MASAGAANGSRPPRVRFRSAVAALVLAVAPGAISPVFAQSPPADSSAERQGASKAVQPVPASAASPADPPNDVLRGAAGNVAAPAAGAGARNRYRNLIEKEAAQNGIAPDIAQAVMAAESGNNPGTVGSAGEIGLMQVMPSTARMLGFNGTLTELAEPATNIHYGVVYLAQAWRLAGGDLCTAAMKYRAGHGETRFSFLSVRYCLAVRAKLTALGYPVTGPVPVATFGEPAGGGGCGRKCITVPQIGHVDLAAINNQLNALVVRAKGGR
jgi:soluble lytic murein transglycosylase-like protein